MSGSRRGPAIGIDLGTTYSCVAVWRNNRVETIINEQGNNTTPSCVAFTETERHVGEAASNQAPMNPRNTIYGVKRLIGRRFADESIQEDMKLCQFKIVPGQDSMPLIVVRFKGNELKLLPEEVSSMVLAKMKSIADDFLGTAIRDAVITCPAYFNDAQRRATKTAGAVAGLNVLQVINEPTAAAIAYGFDNMVAGDIHGSNRPRKVLVFDFGGGTLDVSILHISKGVHTVRATAGDTHLGGEDFDNNMVNYFVEEIRRKHRKDITGDPRAMRRLKTACEKGKRTLSNAHSVEITVESLHEGIDLQSRMTRAKFEELNSKLFARCMQPIEKCLSDASSTKREIDDVVVVGGSGRMPKVQELLRELFEGKELYKAINPDEAIAHGAAIHAAKLCGEENKLVQNLVLEDVTPLSLGVETCGNLMTVVIPRNTPVPVKKDHAVTTYYDNQTSAAIKVYEGERPLTEDNHFLAEFELSGIPRALSGVPEITICFEIDVNGILTVSAQERSIGKREAITISNETGRLKREDIARMIREAEQYKAEDERRKKAMEAKSELESCLYSLKSKMEENPKYKAKMTASGRREITNAIAQATEVLEGAGSNIADSYRFEDMKTTLERILREINAET